VNDAQSDKVENALRRLLDANRVRRPQDHEAGVAAIVAEPRDADEIAEIVRYCEAEKIALAPLGAARTLGQIRRAPTSLGVSLARMARVVSYEPEDMTVIAEAGMTLGALNSRLAGQAQRLPLDPRAPEATILGALIGAAHSGPLRHSEGTPRDLLIGIRFVGRAGRLVHGGGRVVKNVAGYDLMKVMTGSFVKNGTITETAFKLRPIPEGYTIALAPFARAADAFGRAREINDALPLVHLEVLSPAVAASVGYPGAFRLVAGFAGNARELEYQREQLGEKLAALNAVEFADGPRALEVYERVRDFEFASASLAARMAAAPAELGGSLEALGVEFLAHAGCGIAEIFTSNELDSTRAHETVSRWRSAARAARGHLRLLAAAWTIRAHVEFFDQPSAGELKLMRRLKSTFDPAGIFNPGCFVGGL